MIGIVHPDLGIGGAERLVVDVTTYLQKEGKNVFLYTAHHDVTHCFKETVCGDERMDWIRIRGGWFPRNLFGRFQVLCSNLRCGLATLHMILEMKRMDVIIIDQVFLPVLICRMFSNAKITFYCHFPDKLLAKRDSVVRKMYRLVFDALEGLAMSLAHNVVVNSSFTREAYEAAFGLWNSKRPAVVHPPFQDSYMKEFTPQENVVGGINRTFFLSINRFERKKQLHSAILAFKQLRLRLGVQRGAAPYLIIGGGYDERVYENVSHFNELNRLAHSICVQNEILFLPSISDDLKRYLMRESIALIYTPVNEHFGITPLESMAACRPVVACNKGGPCETVIHGETGLLVDGTVDAFAESMHFLHAVPEEADRLGRNGKKRVQNMFTQAHFSAQLNEILQL